MKVLLINPAAERTLLANNPAIIDEERGLNPPLGLLYVAAYLQKHSDHEITVLDAQAEPMNSAALEQFIRKAGPDIVGLTAMTFTLLDVLNIVRIVKAVDYNIRIVLGGPHPWLYPDLTITLEGIDFLVMGEGEMTFLELVNNIDDKDKLREVEGLVFKDHGEIVRTKPRLLNENLDILPYPARHLTDIKKYSSLLARRSPVTTMITSRGCPYRCSFCARPHLGKVFRARSAANVVDEMQECLNLGIKEIFIYDDTFSVNRDRVREICREIIKRRLDVIFDIRTRIDNVDDELLRLLKEAHCERIHYGIESGSDRILKILKKGITIEQIEEVVRKTREAGIAILAYFMIGSPGEAREDVMNTIEFARKIDPDFAHFTIFCFFPETELYRTALEEGVIASDYWNEFARNPGPGFNPPYSTASLSEKELKDLLVYAYKSFYERPSFIVSRLAKIRSFGELKRKIKAGLKVMGMKS